ncbi:unnamed protein product [Symbiodinium pilosum]|uniref:Galectin n=1 Tax=Symbiodinium pilosum TaxID=2952 RepID=A0A812WG07_SYMPI|nr:unnamed protein product [Symbiodinium pilosum]
MFRVWLHAPCQCGAFCCGKGSRRRRKGCFVLRIHVLAAGLCICSLLALLQLSSSTSSERWLAGVQDVGATLDARAGQGSMDLQQRAANKKPPKAKRKKRASTVAPATTVEETTPVPSPWRQLPIDWQKTELGPGFPNEIDSAWTDVGVMESGDVLRIEAHGFSSKESPIAVWGWYLNVWSGDGRHWVTKKGEEEPSRLLHFNPRPRGGGYIAINNFLKGTGWGKEKDVPVPEQWKMENAGKAFVLEVELSDEEWLVKLDGKPQPEMSYVRQGDYGGPLVLQLYDLIKPSVSMKKQIS